MKKIQNEEKSMKILDADLEAEKLKTNDGF